jgi:hypothetical protein
VEAWHGIGGVVLVAMGAACAAFGEDVAGDAGTADAMPTDGGQVDGSEIEGGMTDAAAPVAMYRFAEEGGTTVGDAVEPALDLVIEDAGAVAWTERGLVITAPTRLRSTTPAAKIAVASIATGEISVEAWVQPSVLSQPGATRIVSMGRGGSARNFTLGQRDTSWIGRVTTTTQDGTLANELRTEMGIVDGRLVHLVLRHFREAVADLWVDGKLHDKRELSGTLASWAPDYHLTMANEDGAERPWLGEILHVTIWARALTDDEIRASFAAGAP